MGMVRAPGGELEVHVGELPSAGVVLPGGVAALLEEAHQFFKLNGGDDGFALFDGMEPGEDPLASEIVVPIPLSANH